MTTTTKNHFQSIATVSRVAALTCAGVAAGGATLGFHDMTDSWLVSALFGGGVAAVLGFGWHAVLHAAEHSRRNVNRVALMGAGSALVAVALATSGWSLATAIGGKAALTHAQSSVLAEHAEALGIAAGNVQAQHDIVNATRQAAAAAHMLGDEEGQTGQGPLYAVYQRTGDSLNAVADDMESTLGGAEAAMQAGAQALADGRAALGDSEAFGAAMAAAANATGALNAVDVSKQVLSAGTVGLNDGGLPKLDPLTEQLYAAAEKAAPTPVEVPSYTPMTRSEATWEYAGTVAPAWMAAIGIDAAPLLLLLLVLLLASEPLLRGDREERRKVEAEEIRVTEDNVIGFRKAGE